MSRGDQIDIMAAYFLELDHHVRQVFIFNFLSSSLMGDGPVLAEDAPQVAVGEEDGARSIFTRYGHLFAKMGVITEDNRLHRSPTEPSFPLLPIYPTTPGTELAMFEDAIGLLDPLGQFALSLQFLVSWNPSFILLFSSMKGDGIEE
jgi:hypothetical protein